MGANRTHGTQKVLLPAGELAKHQTRAKNPDFSLPNGPLALNCCMLPAFMHPGPDYRVAAAAANHCSFAVEEGQNLGTGELSNTHTHTKCQVTKVPRFTMC